MEVQELIKRYQEGERNFDKALLRRAILCKPDLTEADLERAKQVRDEVRNQYLAAIPYEKLAISVADDIVFGAILANASWKKINLEEASLAEADLREAGLREANLRTCKKII